MGEGERREVPLKSTILPVTPCSSPLRHSFARLLLSHRRRLLGRRCGAANTRQGRTSMSIPDVAIKSVMVLLLLFFCLRVFPTHHPHQQPLFHPFRDHPHPASPLRRLEEVDTSSCRIPHGCDGESHAGRLPPVLRLSPPTRVRILLLSFPPPPRGSLLHRLARIQ